MPKVIFTSIFNTMKLVILFILFISTISCTNNVIDANLHNNSNIDNQNQSDTLIDYYESGNVKIAGTLLDNKREGLWISYFENGTKQSQHNYKNGLLNGSLEVFLNSGKLLYQGFYLEGKEHGKWIYYNEEQQPIKEIWYENGIKK